MGNLQNNGEPNQEKGVTNATTTNPCSAEDTSGKNNGGLWGEETSDKMNVSVDHVKPELKTTKFPTDVNMMDINDASADEDTQKTNGVFEEVDVREANAVPTNVETTVQQNEDMPMATTGSTMCASRRAMTQPETQVGGRIMQVVRAVGCLAAKQMLKGDVDTGNEILGMLARFLREQ